MKTFKQHVQQILDNDPYQPAEKLGRDDFLHQKIAIKAAKLYALDIVRADRERLVSEMIDKHFGKEPMSTAYIINAKIILP